MKHTMLAFFIFLAFCLAASGCSDSSETQISASGTIEATEVTVSARVGGEINRLLVDEGSSARPGDTLAAIDATDYEIQFRQARSNAEANDAQYVQAEASFKNTEYDLNRMEELWATKSITLKQLEDAQTRFTLAQQTIVAARARRDQARAQADAAQKKLDDCFIRAPIAGVVTQKAVEQGEFVGPGGAVVRLARLDKVFLVIYVSEQELGRVRLGQKASVQIDTYPDRSFPGSVVYISPIAEFTPKNIQTKDDRVKLVFGVKLEVGNPDGSLKPGMPADAIVETQ